MGGHSSGCRDGGPVVEDGWKLDLAYSIRKGTILPGHHVSGTMTWTATRTREVACRIAYEANLTDPDAAWVRLHYTTTARSTGNATVSDYRIRFVTTRPHFSEVRWWFVCPIFGRRARGAVSAAKRGYDIHQPATPAARLPVPTELGR